MRFAIRFSILAVGAALFLAVPEPARAQLGGLIKKKVEKATGQDAAQAEPPKFDAVTLEITVDRIDKLLAAKQAAKQMADGPRSPTAFREKAAPLDARQTALYEKYVEQINAWDEKRRDIERCRGDSLSAIGDRKRLSGPQEMQKMQQLAMAMAMAQQKGDTAEVRRLTEQLQKSQEPTAADSAAVFKRCGDPSPTGVVKEWLALKDQISALTDSASKREAEITRTENSLSGMNDRQRAMMCERIQQIIARLKNQQAKMGFTDAEIEAAKKREQAIKDLEELCKR